MRNVSNKKFGILVLGLFFISVGYGATGHRSRSPSPSLLADALREEERPKSPDFEFEDVHLDEARALEQHEAKKEEIRHEMKRVDGMVQNLEEEFKNIEKLRKEVVHLKKNQRTGDSELRLEVAEDGLKYSKGAIEAIEVTEAQIDHYFSMPEKRKLKEELRKFQEVKAQWQRYRERPFDFSKVSKPLNSDFSRWKKK